MSKRKLSRLQDEKWEIENEFKPIIDTNLADFLIDNAVTSLKQTTESSDKITSRGYAVFVVMIPITSTIIGVLADTVKKKIPGYGSSVIFYCFITFLCLFIFFLLLKLIFPRNTMANGREPKDVIKPQMFQNDYTPNDRLRIFKLNEIKNLQYKIDYNNIQNKSRIQLFKLILFTIFLTYLIGIIYYFKLVL